MATLVEIECSHHKSSPSLHVLLDQKERGRNTPSSSLQYQIVLIQGVATLRRNKLSTKQTTSNFSYPRIKTLNFALSKILLLLLSLFHIRNWSAVPRFS